MLSMPRRPRSQDERIERSGPSVPPQQTPRHLAELFWVFNHLTLLGVGGVLPFAQRILVEDKRWLRTEQFVEMLSLGQVLPGPNLINLALMVGQHFFGWRGAAVALAGMLAAPLVLIFLVAMAYAQYASTPAVVHALQGMSAVVAGMVIAMAIKLFPAIRHDLTNWGWAGLAFAGVGLLRLDLLWVLIALGPIAVALAWWRLRRA
ncbi:chromate transporter [Thiomonas intermedia]|uniref:chromate transporter n=1 Tax=Thiomonas intermedia TaxID=926 RepID=UPI0009A4BAD7|nr:chromate transporter [Thiomonas intermedia]